ncbi:hypothetical protein [Desulfosarcina ovata]|uniref:Uncharacterized protein n=1 Tax=Desulfosarcina ovata subsp. ovata TaxID=2752305 RepID=A0A5K8AIH8_9BACT|nr:hypothetical protein [Desulfosarcina ovata]BBO92471.1 hypothetical protein DSCOOX_56510 [Desulfosarcina ovata subsp. ovata]
MVSLVPKQAHAPNCFHAVLEVASENNNVSVVNGWLFNGRQWILHAWCETDEAVIDLTETHEMIDKATYYRIMGVTPERTVRYTRLVFFTQVAEHGHFGPFDTDFFFAPITAQDPLIETNHHSRPSTEK